MARKPHNYQHFKLLVDQLKSQNHENMLSLEMKMDYQTNVLNSLYTFFVSSRKEDLKLRKEQRLEDTGIAQPKSKKESSSKLDLGRPKGLTKTIADFLATALTGIPGGLSKYLPAKFGLPLMGKLVRGVAALVVGPSFLDALGKALGQDTFDVGITTFLDEFFKLDKRESLAEQIAGATGKGALLGLAAFGIKGAIVGGLLGGGLASMSNLLGQDNIDSKKVYEHVKNYFTGGDFAALIGHPGTGTLVGATIGALIGSGVGPAGTIAGAFIGGAIGMIGSMANKVVKEYDTAKASGSSNPLYDAFTTVIKKHPYFAAALAGGTIGGIVGGVIGGPVGIVLGGLAGAVIGPMVVLLGSFLMDLGKKIWSATTGFREAIGKFVTRTLMAGKLALEGNFADAKDVFLGKKEYDPTLTLRKEMEELQARMQLPSKIRNAKTKADIQALLDQAGFRVTTLGNINLNALKRQFAANINLDETQKKIDELGLKIKQIEDEKAQMSAMSNLTIPQGMGSVQIDSSVKNEISTGTETVILESPKVLDASPGFP